VLGRFPSFLAEYLSLWDNFSSVGGEFSLGGSHQKGIESSVH
jgi:hypothetical protein